MYFYRLHFITVLSTLLPTFSALVYTFEKYEGKITSSLQLNEYIKQSIKYNAKKCDTQMYNIRIFFPFRKNLIDYLQVTIYAQTIWYNNN